MKNLHFYLPVLSLFLGNSIEAQNMDYAHEVISELCSDEMAGRGYVNDGDNAAAFYIEQQFQKHGLKTWDFDYNQALSFAVNSFPEQVELNINGVNLLPGHDFIVDPSCPTIKIECSVVNLKTVPNINNFGLIEDSVNLRGKAVVLEDSLFRNISRSGFEPKAVFNAAGCKAIIVLTDKLTWGVSQNQDRIPVINVLRGRFNNVITVGLDIKAGLKKNHRTQNVLGYFEGENPNRFIVLTGHYDHLGMMGQKAMFKGANDNASGIAMMLNMVEYYSDEKNRPKYSLAFIAFAGEEAGLLGSKHYVQNPVFPLDSIEFLINVDLMGTGEDGITVVNGAIHEEEFNTLVDLNDKNAYLKQVKKRGKAANSDHYPFSEEGVPAFFLYTMGGIAAYHDVHDKPETLPLTEFEDVFRLIRDFISTLDEQ